MLGDALRERDHQYVANRDEVTNTWRILDTWHEALKMVDVDDDIPDDSPAVKILSEGEFIAIIQEASRLGVLQNVPPPLDEEGGELLEDAHMQIDNLQQELNDTKQKLTGMQSRPPHSENFELKELAMQTVLKLTALADVEALTSKDM